MGFLQTIKATVMATVMVTAMVMAMVMVMETRVIAIIESVKA